MKKILVTIALVLILLTTFSAPAFAGAGRIWVGSTTALRGQVAAAVVKMDAVLTAYANSSEADALFDEIIKTSDELSESLERFVEELEAGFDDLSEDEQKAIRDALRHLYYDLVSLAYKGNILFGEGTFMVGVNTESFESLAWNYTVIEPK